MSDAPTTPEPAEDEPVSKFAVSAWAIKNPIPVAVLFIALILAGVISYVTLPIKQFPNVAFPLVSVTVTQNGAAPGELETQVTRPVEDAIAGLSGVKRIQSVVTQGVSTTNIEFEFGEDLQKKTDEVRSRMDSTRALLPRDIDEPTVTRVEIDSAPIVTYAVSAPRMSDVELSWFVDDTVARTLQAQKGVAQVARVGGVDREINVVVDPERLASYGVTAAQVSTALAAFNLDAPGGRVAVGGREQTLRVLGSVQNVDQLRNLTVAADGGRFVRLGDVADVGDGSSEPRGFARLDGRPVVGFQVMRTRDGSDVWVDDAVVKTLAKLEKDHPGVTFTRVIAPVDETRASYHATIRVMLEGMALAALVVFFFLRDWRSTLITAIAMPMSLIPTFFVMKMFGFSIDLITLLALTLVIGILVDDAIVEIENIEKRIERGQRPFYAALVGADSIGLAVVATTMSIVVVFTPVSFMPGIFGQFFKPFGLCVSVAVLFSLLVARLLTPLLAAYLLAPSKAPHARKPFEGFYRNALDWALDHRIISCIVGGVLFVLSLGLVPFIPTGFQPPGDPDYLYVKIQGPPGSTLETMEKTSQEVAKVFDGQPEVSNIFSQIGSSGDAGPFGDGGGGDLREGTVTVILKKERHASGDEIRDRLREKLLLIPDARVSFLDNFGAAGFQQVLAGTNPDNLEKAALALEQQMRTLPIISDPRPSRPPVGPEIVITPRADEAARLGVSTATIAQTARVATVGDIDANVAKLTDGERRVPIRVRLPANERGDIERIQGLRVPTASGAVTTLGAVADIAFEAGPARIDRLNRERQMAVNAELSGATLGQATNAVKNLPIMKNLPAGVHPAAVGDAEAMAEMFGVFGTAIFAGVAMIYGVLVLLFRSFFKPGVILSALPLAVGGAFLGLLVTRQMLSLPSLIGFLMLLGLAAKNSILLVEYAIEQERRGRTQRQALLEACHERARPIVMTTVAMAAGMLPTAIALEKGAEFRQPMAVAVIGGLITSTVLSLVLVPVVYEIADDLETWLRPKFARFMTPRDAPRDAPIDAPMSDAASGDAPVTAGGPIVQSRRGFRLPWSR